MRRLIAIAALVATGAQAQQMATTTEIGKATFSGTGFSVSVVQDTAGGRRAQVFVTDRHVVSTNLMLMNAGDLRSMIKMLDDALVAVDGPQVPPNPQQAELNAIFMAANAGCRQADRVDIACTRRVFACRTSASTPDAAQACLATK